MSVIQTDLKLYKCTSIPTDDSSIAGGAITGTEVTALGDLFPSLDATANADGGADKNYYAKVFYKNDNADTDLTSSKVYIKNALDDPSGATVITIVSDSASDDGTKQVAIYGEDGSNNALVERIALDGTTPVVGSTSFTKVWRVQLELLNQRNTLTTAAGQIDVKESSTILGSMSIGDSWATAEIQIGLEALLDDTNTTTNRLTAPGGISFTRPNSLAEGLDVANSGALSFGHEQGIWIKMIVSSGIGTLPTAGEIFDIVLNGVSGGGA